MLYLLILIVSAVAQYFLPWWVITPICFLLCAWKAESSKQAYGVSFAAIATLWVAYATFIHTSTGGVLTQKITEMILQKIPYPSLLFVATATVGGLVAGFAGMAGHQVRKSL
jgi:hypothetical protein